MAKVKRSLFRSFLNVATPGSPTWALVGEGVTSGSISYNPKTAEETYIHEDSASISVESYAPTFPVESVAVVGDAVFEYLDGIRKARGVLGSAESEVVNVWLYKTPANGFYLAEKQTASLQVDEFGGDGGASAKLNYTINFVGSPVLGVFNPTPTAEFEANPVLAVLTTMTIDALTLVPDFAADKTNLLYTKSVVNATSTVSMNSTLVGSTIVQKCNGSTVTQGANATLNVGLNHLTIEVTISGETVTYYIDITRAAA